MEVCDMDKTKCIFCEQAFQHTTRERKIKGTEAKEIRFIMGHPKCEKLNKKIQKTQKQLQKLRVKTSEAHMTLVGLNYEMFLNKTKKADEEEDDDNECVIAILKKRDIL